MVAKTAHAMIRMLDERRSAGSYERACGLTVADRCDSDGFALLHLRNEASPFERELTANFNHDTPDKPASMRARRSPASSSSPIPMATERSHRARRPLHMTGGRPAGTTVATQGRTSYA